MFETLTEKFEQTIRKIRGLGRITEKNVEEAVREVRLALLDADVHFHVVKDFVERVREKALGQEVLRSLTPEQQFVKIVHDELRRVMGESVGTFDPEPPWPAVVMVVGLHGSGKTTTVAKLGRYLKEERKRQPYLVPADVYRPAAIDQLVQLGVQAGCAVHPTRPGQDPVAIARAALVAAKERDHDVVLLDTAGRLHVDEELMQELERIREAVTPRKILLVVDAMVGQDAVNVAKGFHERLGIDGVVLTKLDGDARGGAALSVHAVTGRPIYFAGTGEKIDALEPFHPDRMASRILGMGDVLTLVERAQRAYDREKAEELERKLRRKEFTIEDFREHLRAVRKMGPLSELLAMVPGARKVLRQIDPERAESELRKVEAIVNSMTREERRDHTILNGSRRRRIAMGSGTTVADVNRFLKQYLEMRKMMKKMSKLAGRQGSRLPV